MIQPSQVAIVCHGGEVYGVGTVVKLYAQYMSEALFVCMQEGVLTDFIRSLGCRVEVADIQLAHTASGSIRTLMKLPGEFSIAREGAQRLLPKLRRHGISLFHSQGSSEYLVGKYLRRHGIKNVWHMHNNTSRTRLMGLGIKMNHIMARHSADMIIAVSQYIAQNWNASRVPVVSVWNAAKPLFHTIGVPKGECVRIVIAGRLEESKGHHLAVEAVIEARRLGLNVSLDIFGDPIQNNAYADRLRGRIAETGNQERIVLRGYITDLRQHHQSYHLGLHCRIDPEPCSVWVCECHADGLPLIASASGGTPELLVNDVTGLLYQPGNQAELTEKLLGLLRQPQRMAAFRVAAFERGRTVFHPRRMVLETLAAYELAFPKSSRSNES